MAVTLNANSSTGFIATSDTSGVLQLQTGGTTAVTVDASQNVTLAGRTTNPTTISVGNATPAASGAGITFPAAISASSDANTLDDYEEGTWTASYGASGSDTGTYIKIGNVVVTQVVLTSAGQTFNTITGCPFTPNTYTPASKSRGNGCSVDINTISIGGIADLVVTNSAGTGVNITTSGTTRLDIQRTFII